MNKHFIKILVLLLLLPVISNSQEVIIKGFPVGVGSSIDRDFFNAYNNKLQSIADSLNLNPSYYAVITGGADGETYKKYNDAKNPGLALGRAHALHALLIDEFKVNASQLILKSVNVRSKGESYRYASVRLVSDISKIHSRLNKLAKGLDSLSNRPPIEKHFTEVQHVTEVLPEPYGLQLSTGLSSSPFGGIPTISSAVTWRQIIFFEIVGGHTFWNSNFEFEGENLDTKRRLIGAHITYYPFEKYKLGFVGGWVRIEEVSQRYLDYVKLSEGPVIGLKYLFNDFLSISSLYNPSKHRIAGDKISISKNGQFIFSLNLFKDFGGTK